MVSGFLEWRRMNDRVLAFCDQKYEELLFVNDKEVLPYEEAKKKGFLFWFHVKMMRQLMRYYL